MPFDQMRIMRRMGGGIVLGTGRRLWRKRAAAALRGDKGGYERPADPDFPACRFASGGTALLWSLSAIKEQSD